MFAIAGQVNLVALLHIHRSASVENSRSEMVKSYTTCPLVDLYNRMHSGTAGRRLPASEEASMEVVSKFVTSEVTSDKV